MSLSLKGVCIKCGNNLVPVNNINNSILYKCERCDNKNNIDSLNNYEGNDNNTINRPNRYLKTSYKYHKILITKIYPLL